MSTLQFIVLILLKERDSHGLQDRSQGLSLVDDEREQQMQTQ